MCKNGAKAKKEKCVNNEVAARTQAVSKSPITSAKGECGGVRWLGNIRKMDGFLF